MTDTPAIPAATLILAREPATQGPPELLMVERAAGMAFAAGAMVFPGGRVDPGDVELGERLGAARGAAIVAAIRETLEETAVPVALDPLPSPELALAMQRDLLADVPFGTLLDRHGLAIIPAALTPFAHWIPSLHVARRFDTLFLLAESPPGDWRPIIGERENRRAEWMSASETLRRADAGEASIIFPTRCNLQRLAQHESIVAMQDDAARHPVEPVIPWIEEREGERMLTIPGHLGYPIIRAPLDVALRG